MAVLLDHPAVNATVFFPRETSSPPPDGARDVMLPVGPDVRLHARVHAAPAAVATVVLFHGNGEVVADYDDAATAFARAGAALAVIDFRGYGQSEGTPTLRTLVADARPALDAMLPELTGNRARPTIVMGRSLGSACAAEIAVQAPEGIAGIVFESGFSELAGVAVRRGLALVPDEEDLAVLCPLRKLRASRLPLLVLHGERDTLILPAEGRAAFEASAASDKQLVLVPGRGHNDLSWHTSYWEALGALVARVAAPQ
jgi:alpha-beta hydrolase superfamily lysophospholipase